MIILRGRQRLCPAVFIMAFAILFWWKAVRRVGEKFGKTYRKARAKIHKKREEWLEKIRKLDPDNKDPYERRGMVTDEQLRWIRKKLQRPLYNQDLHPLKWDGKYITDSGLVVQVEQIDGQLRATAAAAWSPAKGTFHEDMGNTVTMLGMHATLGKDGIVRWENGRKWLSYEAKEMALWKMKFRSFFSQPNAFNVNTSLPHRVTDLVHLDFSINDRPAGRVLIGLYGDVAPITCENFRALCTGEKGESRLGTDLTYKESYIHRIVPGFLIQGGDIVRGDGRSGESIYGKYFPDETFQVKHDRAFVVSMANAGNDTNQSQFFITLKKSPWLDGKNVAFGSVLLGQEVIYRISQQADEKNEPFEDIVISGCGQFAIPTEPLPTSRISQKIPEHSQKIPRSSEKYPRNSAKSRELLEAEGGPRKRARELPRLAAPPERANIVFTKSEKKVEKMVLVGTREKAKGKQMAMDARSIGDRRFEAKKVTQSDMSQEKKVPQIVTQSDVSQSAETPRRLTLWSSPPKDDAEQKVKELVRKQIRKDPEFLKKKSQAQIYYELANKGFDPENPDDDGELKQKDIDMANQVWEGPTPQTSESELPHEYSDDTSDNAPSENDIAHSGARGESEMFDV
ncbi:hypothetical protein AAMO2058_001038400 [Amorphochlora amoebiformis]